jgi:hypothetical protein
MKLRPALNSFIVEDLKQLVRLCGGPGPDGVRKEQLVEYIAGRLTNPVVLAEIWRRLDPLSQKAVATAYYAGGEFSPEAFVAQYGELPGQMFGLSLPSMIYVFNRELSPVELFIHGGEIPEEIMELPAGFADSLALPRRSRKVDGNDGLAAVAETNVSEPRGSRLKVDALPGGEVTLGEVLEGQNATR